MNIGINQNIVHNGETYHIQTEDGGESHPVITTLLFKGGVILASKRTDYSNYRKTENLENRIRELIKLQHQFVIDGLKRGDFKDIKPEAPKAPFLAATVPVASQRQAASETPAIAVQASSIKDSFTGRTIADIVNDFLLNENASRKNKQ